MLILSHAHTYIQHTPHTAHIYTNNETEHVETFPEAGRGTTHIMDSIHGVNAQNRPFPARIDSLLVLVHLMAMIDVARKANFRGG